MTTRGLGALATLLVLSSVSASAAAWALFTVGPSSTSFIDPSSVVRVGRDRLVWTYTDHGGASHESSRTLYELDCSHRRLRSLQTTTYAGPDLSGRVVADVRQDGPWIAVAAGTFETALVASLCRQAG